MSILVTEEQTLKDALATQCEQMKVETASLKQKIKCHFLYVHSIIPLISHHIQATAH